MGERACAERNRNVTANFYGWRMSPVCERFANLGGGGGIPPGFSAASPEPFGAHIFYYDMPCHGSHLVSVCGTGGPVVVSQRKERSPTVLATPARYQFCLPPQLIVD